jgi:hypothetical protein
MSEPTPLNPLDSSMSLPGANTIGALALSAALLAVPAVSHADTLYVKGSVPEL